MTPPLPADPGFTALTPPAPSLLTNVQPEVEERAGLSFSIVRMEGVGLGSPVCWQEGRVFHLLLPRTELNCPPLDLAVGDGVVEAISLRSRKRGAVLSVHLSFRSAGWGCRVERAGGWPEKILLRFPRRLMEEVLREKVVLLDPAHGGEDEGARGPVNLREKDVVLKVALAAGKVLARYGARVFLTREEDRHLLPLERAEMARCLAPHLWLELHTGHEGREARGYRVVAGEGEERMGFLLHREMRLSRLPDRGLAISPGLGGRVVLEMVNLAHPLDEALMRNPDFREKLARRILVALFRRWAER